MLRGIRREEAFSLGRSAWGVGGITEDCCGSRKACVWCAAEESRRYTRHATLKQMAAYLVTEALQKKRQGTWLNLNLENMEDFMLAVIHNFAGFSLEKTLSSYGGVRVSPAQQDAVMSSGAECFGQWEVERWHATPAHEHYFGVYEDLGNAHVSRWLTRLFSSDNLRIAATRIQNKTSEAWADCVDMALGLCFLWEFAAQFMTDVVTIDLGLMRNRIEASLQRYRNIGMWLIVSTGVIVQKKRGSAPPWRIRPASERAAATVRLSFAAEGCAAQWVFENQIEAGDVPHASRTHKQSFTDRKSVV